MSKWFIIQQGRLTGPLTVTEVRKMIRIKQLGPYDRATDSSVAGAWMALYLCQPFEDSFSRDEIEQVDNLWVVLKKGKSDKDFVQRRPLSLQAVKRAIKLGEVSYSDFIWRPGMCQWYRVSFLSEFCKADVLGSVDFPDVPTVSFPKTEEVTEDLSEAIVEQRTKKEPVGQQQVEEIPVEAEGPNLATNFDDPKEIQDLKKAWAKRQPDRRQQPDRRSVPRRLFGRERRRSNYFNAGNALIFIYEIFKKSVNRPKLVAFAAVVFIGAVVGSYISVITLKDKNQSTLLGFDRILDKVIPPAKPAPKKISKPIPQKVEKIVEKKTFPTFFKFRFSGLKSKEAYLEILTDASSHFPIEIEFYGGAGEILNRNSIYLKKQFRFSNLEKSKKINLYSLGLSDGKYQIHAQLESFQKGSVFFLGKKDKAFFKNLKLHKKRMSFWFQEERLALLDQIDRYVEWLANKKGINGTELSKELGSLNRLAQSQLNAAKKGKLRHFVLPKKWMRLGDLSEELEEELKKHHKSGQAWPSRRSSYWVKTWNKEKQSVLSASLWK